MEFTCSVQSLRNVKNIHRISVWTSTELGLLTYKEQEEIKDIINTLGRFSAQAQHLRSPITDYARIKAGSHILYMYTTGVPGKPELIIAKGMLKVGRKNLFIRKDNGQLVEMSPLCVLDFYIHESCQRIGLGHELFEAMLERAKTRAHEIGYDRPSSKFLSFLAKYYNLTDYLPQANQYVVFKDYFHEQTMTNGGSAINEWCIHIPRAVCLDSSCKNERVLHGRRANSCETSTLGTEVPLLKKAPEAYVKESNLTGTTVSQLTSQQPLRRKRQSRHHKDIMGNIVVPDKVPCSVYSNEPQSHTLVHSYKSEIENINRINIAFGDYYKPSIHGRRSMLSNSRDIKRQQNNSFIRYPSPPKLPKPLQDEPMDEKTINPYKFPRTQNTRTRLFHEDSFFDKHTTSVPALKCPFWTDEDNTFSRRDTDSTNKISARDVPTNFENTRSCYHAGMRGFSAAEALGWSNSFIK